MYHDKFEESINWTQDLLTSFSISCFVNNLNDEIKVEVRVFHLNSMTNLAGLGQLQMGNYKGFNIQVKYFKGELCFRGRWAPKLTKGPCNSSNWAQDLMKVWKLSWRISAFSISKNALCWFWEK